ncbi:MAG: nucleotidyltransferase family protein [Alistipes senegalensis]|nr:nucleotidyltransferase family protein [Alistipes senegalensis]
MTTDKYVIHLVKCTLKNEQPQEKPENLSWDKIFSLTQKHMITNIAWYSVNKLTGKPDSELWTKWTEIKNKAIAKDITQRNEYKKIIAAFDKEKIRCMAVKGIFLKKMYPKSDFRTMSDIDILIDTENADKAGNIMLALGYTCESKEKSHHDVYFKPPVMNIEIHRQLFSDILQNNFNQYYENAFINAEKIDSFEFVYKMTDEEFYIYTLAHFYKHYSNGGSGIRSVIDIYIMNNTIYEKLDKKSLNCKLKKLQLLDFRKEMTALSEMWFDENKESAELIKLSNYILGSGTYGTMFNNVNNQIRKKGRAGYFVYCVFLPLNLMQNNYPVLKKLPFLLPVLWIWRLIISLITKRNVVIFKIKVIFQKTKIYSNSTLD